MTLPVPVPGERLPAATVGPFDVDSLDAYAAAAGDHNPVHLDAAFARSVGLSDRVAHGMLVMGRAGQVLSAWRPDATIERFEGRFTLPVPVGTTLVVDGRVVSVETHDNRARVLVRLVGKLPDGKIALMAGVSMGLDT